MAKRCPPGVICIENCTILLIFIAIGLLYLILVKPKNNNYTYSGAGLNTQNTVPDVPLMDRFPAHMFNNRDVLRDPYAPPLRDTRVFPTNSSDPRGIPINVSTQGHDSEYRQVGIITRNNGDETILPLMGRPLLTNRDKWQYYTMSDSNNSVKLPISKDGRSCTDEYGCESLYNGDNVYIEGYNDAFNITVYDNNKPNYIPYL